MKRQAKIIIVGLGSAGLSALNEVQRVTDDFLLIQDGPYGTSCARSACMPTKTLIEVAKAYHWRGLMAECGVSGTEQLTLNTATALRHVRKLRDKFVKGMIRDTDQYRQRIIPGQAVFLEPTVLKVGETIVEGERIIIATGSRPVYPESWMQFSDLILNTDEMVELPDLPESMAVVGLGPAGIEYAQALSRLGVALTGFSRSGRVGGITDPEVNDAVIALLQKEFPMVLRHPVEITRHGSQLHVRAGDREVLVDRVLMAVGRRPNIDTLGLEKIGVATNSKGLPVFSKNTMQIGDLPIYIAGDANGDVPILHEAIDEGHIAGFNAVSDKPHCLNRRVPLAITFTDPNIAAVGKRLTDLREGEYVTGRYDFSKQARALMSGTNKGLLRIYVDRKEGHLLGAEMAAPAGEHLAHYLAMAIHRRMTVNDLLTLPIYHPVIEEGLRSAIREAGRKISSPVRETDLLLCRSEPHESLT